MIIYYSSRYQRPSAGGTCGRTALMINYDYRHYRQLSNGGMCRRMVPMIIYYSSTAFSWRDVWAKGTSDCWSLSMALCWMDVGEQR